MSTPQKKDRQKVIDSIPDIEGREFQYELPLASDDVKETFMTPIATGASLLQVHTAQMQADRGSFPRIFRRMVDASGDSQKHLAESMGLKRQSLNQYIAGYRVNPSMEFVLRLAAVCGCRILIEYPRRISRS